MQDLVVRDCTRVAASADIEVSVKSGLTCIKCDACCLAKGVCDDGVAAKIESLFAANSDVELEIVFKAECVCSDSDRLRVSYVGKDDQL